MSEIQQGREGQRPIVMVIDDNPAIRDMISWALELDGYEPAEAAEGQEALNWLRDVALDGRLPSVILLDLAMPGMNGATFLERFRRLWQETSSASPMPGIIVITAGTHGPDAANLGVGHVLVKPFHVRDLLNIVRRMLQTA